MPDNNQTKRSDCTVEAAREGRYGLQVKVDGRWTDVESKAQFLDKEICILIGGVTSGTHFHDTYEVFYPGNPEDNCAAWMLKGGTDSQVVAMLMEQWATQPNRPTGTKLKVPSVETARGALPTLQAARHARDDA